MATLPSLPKFFFDDKDIIVFPFKLWGILDYLHILDFVFFSLQLQFTLRVILYSFQGHSIVVRRSYTLQSGILQPCAQPVSSLPGLWSTVHPHRCPVRVQRSPQPSQPTRGVVPPQCCLLLVPVTSPLPVDFCDPATLPSLPTVLKLRLFLYWALFFLPAPKYVPSSKQCLWTKGTPSPTCQQSPWAAAPLVCVWLHPAPPPSAHIARCSLVPPS